MICIEGEKEKGIGGRKPFPIEYKHIIFNSNPYVVGTIIHNLLPLKFVIDEDDFEKVKSRHWHAVTSYFQVYLF